MNFQRRLTLLLVLSILIVMAVAITVAARANSTSATIPTPAKPAQVATVNQAQIESALGKRLHAAYLTYQWITCTPLRKSYSGHQLFRCNVNFGDPHIEPYCATLISGKLVTDHENTHINCGKRLNADELAKGGEGH